MHISDVNPYSIASAVKQLAHPNHVDNPVLNPLQMTRCGIAVLEGSYGASSGTQAHQSVILELRARASGPVPAVLNHSNNRPAPSRQELQRLADDGYFAVMVEIVSSETGRALSPAYWDALVRNCRDAGLFVIVDEGLTAVRCGAPFAHQRPEYSIHAPSMVLFRKGFRVAGLAVNPQGCNIHRLGLDTTGPQALIDKIRAARELVSQVVPLSDITHAHAVLVAAQAEDWPARASRIGDNLRRVIGGLAECSSTSTTAPAAATRRSTRPSTLDSTTSNSNRNSNRNNSTGSQVALGLGSLIYLPRHVAAQHSVVGADAGPSLIRWMPFLDEGMEKHATISGLFGKGSYTLRASLLQRLEWCTCCSLSTVHPGAGYEPLPTGSGTGGLLGGGTGGTGDADVPLDALFNCRTCACPLCYWCRKVAKESPGSPAGKVIMRHLSGKCLLGRRTPRR